MTAIIVSLEKTALSRAMAVTVNGGVSEKTNDVSSYVSSCPLLLGRSHRM